MNSRCRRLTANLTEREAFFVTSSENVFYLSGFSGEGMLLLSLDRAVLITDFRYIEDAQKRAEGFMVADIARGIRDIVPSEIRTLYIEEENMTLAQLRKYGEVMPGVRFADGGGDKIAALRLIKEAEEIEKITKAADIATKAFSEVLSLMKPGVTERELALEFEYRVKKAGGGGVSFDTIVASGPNSSMPHAGVTDRVLTPGDFVTMDFGCVYDGYCSDMTRTVAVGSVSDKQRKVYETVLAAQLAALEAVRAGAACADVDAVARAIIADAGYGDAFGHALGHGVGVQIHEEPRLSARSQQVLSDNMVVTVEPGIYLPGDFGVRIEDLVVVNGEKTVNLSHFTKELLIL